MRGVAPISLKSPGTTTTAWPTTASHMVILGSVSLHHLYLVLGSSHGAFAPLWQECRHFPSAVP